MSTPDDRLETAGREVRTAFDRMRPPAVEPRRSGNRAVSFGLGAAAVALLVAIPAVLWGGEPAAFGGADGPQAPADSTSTPTSAIQPATTTAPAPPSTCGPQLPFPVELPDDFDGPFGGPSPDADTPLEEGQLGVHWTGRGGSLEVRWPTDRRYRVATEATVAPVDVSFILLGRESGPEVFADNPHLFPDAGPDSGSDWIRNDCHVAQLSVYGAPGEAASVNVVGAGSDPSGLRLAPTLPRSGDDRLIADSLEVEVVPDVIPCQGPSDEPTLSGTVGELTTHPTPAGALGAFIENRERWPALGYVEFSEADGTITYGRLFESDPMTAPTPDDGLVIAVSVVALDDGWAVDSWESSGC